MSTQRPLPVYTYPCLVQSTAKPSTTPSFYLMGILDKGLELNSVNLTDINSPIFQSPKGDDDKHWSSSAPLLCFNYAEISGAQSLRIHVQQFSNQTTFEATVLPNGNETAEFLKSNSGFQQVSFLSPRQFALVGQAGEIMYAVGKTNRKDGSTYWSGLTVNSTDGVASTPIASSPDSPSDTVPLVVGTFDIKPAPDVTGSIVAFDAKRDSGQIYSTTGMRQTTIRVDKVGEIQMNGITLSSDAIPIHMGLTAYILDKADDGSVTIYQITPPALTRVDVALSSLVLPFSASMVGSTMASDGSATASQIIVYSVQNNVAQFNRFDINNKTWSGLGLVDRSSLKSGNGKGTNGGNSSSGTSNAAIIGGAVAGVLVLVLIAAFFIVRRKRQRRGRGRVSQKHSSAGGRGGGGGGSSNLGAEEREENKPVLSDYQQQQNRASLQMAEPSRGSIITLNSSSTRSGVQFVGSSQPGQPTSAPLTVPQQLQLQQQQIQQQQQQQQQSRRGVSSHGMEVLSLPVILEQHPFDQHSEGDDEEQLRKLEQESPFVARPYSNVPSFSYPTVYQDQPRHQHQPVRTTVINPYSGASVVDDEEQEPYVLPDPIIVAPTPVPHKAELLD